MRLILASLRQPYLITIVFQIVAGFSRETEPTDQQDVERKGKGGEGRGEGRREKEKGEGRGEGKGGEGEERI